MRDLVKNYGVLVLLCIEFILFSVFMLNISTDTRDYITYNGRFSYECRNEATGTSSYWVSSKAGEFKTKANYPMNLNNQPVNVYVDDKGKLFTEYDITSPVVWCINIGVSVLALILVLSLGVVEGFSRGRFSSSSRR